MKGSRASIALAVLLALIWIGQMRRSVGQIAASRTLLLVESRTQQLLLSGLGNERLFRADAARLEAVASYDASNPAIPLAIGSQYFYARDPRRAAIWYRRALALEPRPEGYLNLGRALRRSGDQTGAVENFEILERLDPRGLIAAPERDRPAPGK